MADIDETLSDDEFDNLYSAVYAIVDETDLLDAVEDAENYTKNPLHYYGMHERDFL